MDETPDATLKKYCRLLALRASHIRTHRAAAKFIHDEFAKLRRHGARDYFAFQYDQHMRTAILDASAAFDPPTKDLQMASASVPQALTFLQNEVKQTPCALRFNKTATPRSVLAESESMRGRIGGEWRTRIRRMRNKAIAHQNLHADEMDLRIKLADLDVALGHIDDFLALADTCHSGGGSPQASLATEKRATGGLKILVRHILRDPSRLAPEGFRIVNRPSARTRGEAGQRQWLVLDANGNEVGVAYDAEKATLLAWLLANDVELPLEFHAHPFTYCLGE